MKKILFSTLVVAAMASCSNDLVSEVENTDLVKIKMTSSVTASTRTAIESGENGFLTEDLGVNFLRAADAATVDWASAVTEVVPATIKATTGEVEFVDIQYYSSDETKLSHLFGFYAGDDYSLSAGVLTAPIDGELDVLYALPVSGDKTTTEPLAPVFDHALTRIKIIVQGDAGAAVAWGNVTGVTIKDVAEDVEITVSDSPGIAYNGTGQDITLTGSTAITDAPIEFGERLIDPKDLYTLEISTENGTADVPVTIGDTGAEAGKVSEITLTFKGQRITATATVTDWEAGNNGGADVE